MTLAKAVHLLTLFAFAVVVKAVTDNDLALGSLFYLPEKMILAQNQFQGGGHNIITVSPNCIKNSSNESQAQWRSEQYESTQELVQSSSFGFRLDAGFPIQNLVFSASISDVATDTMSYSQHLVSSRVFIEWTMGERSYQDDPECWVFQDAFLNAFENVPDISEDADISNTADGGPWGPYLRFLTTEWGSHVMTGQKLGGAIWEFASSTDEAFSNAHIMQVRACADVQEHYHNGSIQGCGNYTDEERQQAMSSSVRSQKRALGADQVTNTHVMDDLSSANIEQFARSVSHNRNPYSYTFKPIWEKLKAKYGPLCNAANLDHQNKDCKHLQKAYNLQAAFEAILAYGCKTDASDGSQQRLEVNGDGNFPRTYKCMAKYTGCQNDDSCGGGQGVDGGGCACKNNCYTQGEEIAKDVFRSIPYTFSSNPSEGANQACQCSHFLCGQCTCNKQWGLQDRAIYTQV